MATFFCRQGCHCREVQLYMQAWPRSWTGTPKNNPAGAKSGTRTQGLPSNALATRPLLCSSGVRKTLDAKSVFFRRACGVSHAHPAHVFVCMKERKNRSFLSCPSLCFKSRVSAKPPMWKLFHILIQIKLIFTRKVLHFTSFWKWEFLELGNSLFLLFYRLLDQVYPILFDWNNALFLLQYFAVEQERERTV